MMIRLEPGRSRHLLELPKSSASIPTWRRLRPALGPTLSARVPANVFLRAYRHYQGGCWLRSSPS